MRYFVSILLASLTWAQQPSIPPPPIASPQPAQTINIQIGADLATALENLRLNLREQKAGTKPGSVVVEPRYATITELVAAALTSKSGGLFAQALQRFPPASVKASQDAAKKAADDAAAVQEKVLSSKQ